MEEFNLVVSAIVAIILIAILIFGYSLTQKRRIQLGNLAKELGLSFHPKDKTKRLPYMLGRFKFFTNTHSHKAKNLLSGEGEGMQYIISDLFFTVSDPNKKNNVTGKHLTLMILESSEGNLPPFAMRPSPQFTREMEGYRGMEDIDFQTHAAFSNQYRLMSEDEPAVRNLFEAQILDYFSQNPGLTLEANGRFIFLLHHPQLLEATSAQYEDLLKKGKEVAKVLFT